jgi:hypothetical protein
MSPEGRYLPLLRIIRTGAAQRATKRPGRRELHLPGTVNQGRRLGQRFQRLQESIEHRRLELREELAGVEPEMAVVLETVGSVQGFINAARRVRGLEWLGELDSEVAPDEDFYDPKDRERVLGGSLYLVMTDRRALDELLSLWRRWQEEPDESLGWGWNRFREIFARLHDIRPWGAEDRLRETGLAEVWRERIEDGENRVRTEIELWFRKSTARRRQATALVEKYVTQAGGRIVGQSTIEEIAYHGILAELPAAAAEKILDLDEVALVRCDDVMFLRPVGQTGAPGPEDVPGPELPPPVEVPQQVEPTVALFDGLPLERHRHLEGRLTIDDPDDWAAQIPAGVRHHGTAMASLILHGDLGSGEAPLERPLYVRPILKPFTGFQAQAEIIPEDVLPVDLLHRAVRRLFIDEEGNPGVAPSIRVVNLSIGDRSRPFDRMVSPFARLLDWLAWKHQLLIVVSAGNHSGHIELSRSLSELTADELQAELWRAIRQRAHLQRLLAPAESLNALTIGAEHRDACQTFELRHLCNPAVTNEVETVPSPITAWGPGPARAVKPDVFLPGGRQLYREDPGLRLRPSTATASPPGQSVAAAGTPPDLGRIRYTVGTSNSAALASRAAGRILERLPELIEDFDGIERRFIAPLLKAFLVHGATWGNARALCERLFDSDKRKDLGRFLGFGFADIDRVLGCTDHRVTLVSWGELARETGDVYTVPLPYGLSGLTGARRLITTLAWLSPINPYDRRYRQADLWVDSRGGSPQESIGVTRADADYHAAMRGTVHHEVWEGEQAAVFAEADEIALRVSCREHAKGLVGLVPYALLVTLEVAPELNVQVYQQVRTKVAARVRV